MSNSREFGWKEIAEVTTLVSTVSAIGTGLGAAIRGGSIADSALLSAAGTGLATFGFGLFGKPSQKKPSNAEIILGMGAFQLLGTGAGYIGAKLFINAATSPFIFVDTALGFPVSTGLFFCAGLAAKYYIEREQHHKDTPRPHFR